MCWSSRRRPTLGVLLGLWTFRLHQLSSCSNEWYPQRALLDTGIVCRFFLAGCFQETQQLVRLILLEGLLPAMAVGTVVLDGKLYTKSENTFLVNPPPPPVDFLTLFLVSWSTHLSFYQQTLSCTSNCALVEVSLLQSSACHMKIYDRVRSQAPMSKSQPA